MVGATGVRPRRGGSRAALISGGERHAGATGQDREKKDVDAAPSCVRARGTITWQRRWGAQLDAMRARGAELFRLRDALPAGGTLELPFDPTAARLNARGT